MQVSSEEYEQTVSSLIIIIGEGVLALKQVKHDYKQSTEQLLLTTTADVAANTRHFQSQIDAIRNAATLNETGHNTAFNAMKRANEASNGSLQIAEQQLRVASESIAKLNKNIEKLEQGIKSKTILLESNSLESDEVLAACQRLLNETRAECKQVGDNNIQHERKISELKSANTNLEAKLKDAEDLVQSQCETSKTHAQTIQDSKDARWDVEVKLKTMVERNEFKEDDNCIQMLSKSEMNEAITNLKDELGKAGERLQLQSGMISDYEQPIRGMEKTTRDLQAVLTTKDKSNESKDVVIKEREQKLRDMEHEARESSSTTKEKDTVIRDTIDEKNNLAGSLRESEERERVMGTSITTLKEELRGKDESLQLKTKTITEHEQSVRNMTQAARRDASTINEKNNIIQGNIDEKNRLTTALEESVEKERVFAGKLKETEDAFEKFKTRAERTLQASVDDMKTRMQQSSEILMATEEKLRTITNKEELAATDLGKSQQTIKKLRESLKKASENSVAATQKLRKEFEQELTEANSKLKEANQAVDLGLKRLNTAVNWLRPWISGLQSIIGPNPGLDIIQVLDGNLPTPGRLGEQVNTDWYLHTVGLDSLMQYPPAKNWHDPTMVLFHSMGIESRYFWLESVELCILREIPLDENGANMLWLAIENMTKIEFEGQADFDYTIKGLFRCLELLLRNGYDVQRCSDFFAGAEEYGGHATPTTYLVMQSFFQWFKLVTKKATPKSFLEILLQMVDAREVTHHLRGQQRCDDNY